MKGPNTVFVCQSCGSQSRKWLGRCADCGEWNSLVEERAPAASNAGAPLVTAGNGAQLFSEIGLSNAQRLSTGVSELDRVLGGGLVPGSLVLLGGEPGIGKSTISVVARRK